MLFPAALAIVVLATARTASADERCPAWEKAVELAQKAKTHLDSREYDDALEDLRAAYGLCPDAKLRRGIARVFEEAGRLPEAVAAFRACAEEGGDPGLKADCTAKADALVARRSQGIVRLDVTPPSAAVFVDGSDQPQRADVLRLPAGRHEVRLEAAGKKTHVAIVTVEAGKESVLTVVMEAPPAPPMPPVSPGATRIPAPETAHTAKPPIATAPPVPPPVAGGVASAPSPDPEPVDTVSTTQPSAVWNWVGIGASVAIVGTGLAFLIRYGMDRAAAEGPVYVGGQVQYEGDVIGNSNVIAGSVLLAAGVAGVITSAVLWPKAPARIDAGPVPGGGSVAVHVAF